MSRHQRHPTRVNQCRKWRAQWSGSSRGSCGFFFKSEKLSQLVKLYNHLAARQGNLCAHALALRPTVGFSEAASIYCVPIMYRWHLGGERGEESRRKRKILWKMEHLVLSVGYSLGFMGLAMSRDSVAFVVGDSVAVPCPVPPASPLWVAPCVSQLLCVQHLDCGHILISPWYGILTASKGTRFLFLFPMGGVSLPAR